MQTLLAVSILGALAWLSAAAATAVLLALKSGGRRHEADGDRDALAESRFTIPVSLIVPLGASDGLWRSPVQPATGEPPDRDIVAALLALNYPEIEVILVADEDADYSQLKATWELAPTEFFYRQSLPTGRVHRIHRSTRDPRLLLVEKEPRGRADAVNCGINLARFRYAAVVDADVRFDGDALLRAMAVPLRDPAGVVAASSQVAVGGHAFDALWSARALLESRILWSRVRGGIGPDRRVVVWRRDAVLQQGGLSHEAADPALDLMARLHATAASKGDEPAPAVVRTAAIFGTAPSRGAAALARFRATGEAMASLARTRAIAAAAWLFLSRVATPALAGWVVGASVIAAWTGWLPWRDAAFALAAVSFGLALVSTAALLVRGSASDAPDDRALARLLLLAPLELVAGPFAAAGRARGASGPA